jgi:hypothetical protein
MSSTEDRAEAGAPPNSRALQMRGRILREATGPGMAGSRLGSFLKKESFSALSLTGCREGQRG